jgi:hypothetical protein
MKSFATPPYILFKAVPEIYTSYWKSKVVPSLSHSHIALQVLVKFSLFVLLQLALPSLLYISLVSSLYIAFPNDASLTSQCQNNFLAKMGLHIPLQI